MKYRAVVYLLAGFVLGAGSGIAAGWIFGSPFNQETAMLPAQSPVAIAIEQTAPLTTSPRPQISPSSTVVNSAQTTDSVPSPTESPSATATPTPSPTPAPTHKPTAKPTKTPAPSPSPTDTPEPTSSFSYTVSNDDGVAPAGYTIIYIKITPGGSYHVTYDGTSITKTKSGSGYITYYATVPKLDGGGYRSKVSVSVN